jgi:hypothetical protein
LEDGGVDGHGFPLCSEEEVIRRRARRLVGTRHRTGPPIPCPIAAVHG